MAQGLHLGRGEIFSCLKNCPDLHRGPPSILLNECQSFFLCRVNRPDHDVGHSLTSSAEVKNDRSYTSTDPSLTRSSLYTFLINMCHIFQLAIRAACSSHLIFLNYIWEVCSQTQLYQLKCLLVINYKTTCFGTLLAIVRFSPR